MKPGLDISELHILLYNCNAIYLSMKGEHFYCGFSLICRRWRNCLKDEAIMYDEEEFNNHIAQKPGQLYGPNEQCSQHLGTDSFYGWVRINIVIYGRKVLCGVHIHWIQN